MHCAFSGDALTDLALDIGTDQGPCTASPQHYLDNGRGPGKCEAGRSGVLQYSPQSLKGSWGFGFLVSHLFGSSRLWPADSRVGHSV